jgi:uncharacterized protein (TIGR02217 family)
MTSFIETPRFPEDISYDSRGGPRFNTRRVQVASGQVIRNQIWSYPVHEFDVAYGVNTVARHENLLYYFMVVGGTAVGFRYKDWMDFKSCLRANTPAATDCALGTGDDVTAAFQLKKIYTQGAYTRARKILKPISGTVLVAVAGTLKTETTHYTVNYATGIVTFTAGNIPTAGQAVTAGFEFDVPVCFDQDVHQYTWSDFASGTAQVPLVELKYGDT